MAQGLKVWDASGNVVLDTSTRVGRLLGSVAVNTATGSVMNADFAQGTVLWFLVPIGTGGAQQYPAVSYSSGTTTLSWSGAFTSATFQLWYGVY